MCKCGLRLTRQSYEKKAASGIKNRKKLQSPAQSARGIAGGVVGVMIMVYKCEFVVFFRTFAAVGR